MKNQTIQGSLHHVPQACNVQCHSMTPLSMESDSTDIHFPWYPMKTYSDPPINKASPSEDDHFAESVLWGGKCAAKLVLLPTLNTQVWWNIVQMPMEQQASTSSQLPQTQGMTHPPSATLQSLGGIDPPIPPVGPATQGAKP
ncbi:hypothetical protein EDD16DRAFT_1526654 [Pisolithus croceorrhizus]|nr:hypothetical protein EV401DRAFT_1895389 [Pisolithus croceorrhizus]KAI6100028.1 hypothetical protein EDD16DRAFT_1526654 [Pisolithus croceorrhizus]KAI6166499.1 hypothetical protein EDD17DRAFT_1504920 [Pisolithus thermaeus]